jgi:exodeoxyribonuclease VII large subunit
MSRAVAVQQARQQHVLDAWDARLQALNPRKVLERGYAWLSHDDGRPITSVMQAEAGQALRGVMADGVLHLSVEAVSPGALPDEGTAASSMHASMPAGKKAGVRKRRAKLAEPGEPSA